MLLRKFDCVSCQNGSGKAISLPAAASVPIYLGIFLRLREITPTAENFIQTNGALIWSFISVRCCTDLGPNRHLRGNYSANTQSSLQHLPPTLTVGHPRRSNFNLQFWSLHASKPSPSSIVLRLPFTLGFDTGSSGVSDMPSSSREDPPSHSTWLNSHPPQLTRAESPILKIRPCHQCTAVSIGFFDRLPKQQADKGRHEPTLVSLSSRINNSSAHPARRALSPLSRNRDLQLHRLHGTRSGLQQHQACPCFPGGAHVAF